jgi:hypothetical protein
MTVIPYDIIPHEQSNCTGLENVRRSNIASMRLFSTLPLLFLVGNTYASCLDLGIPHSSATVDVRVFNVANGTLVNQAHTFFSPILGGHENGMFPMFSFLVEHKTSKKRLMFDLGIRKGKQLYIMVGFV